MWKEKVVVVAGGSKGLGAKIADAFHGRGANVVILARTSTHVDVVVENLNARRDHSASGLSLDLLDDSARQQAIRSIVDQHQRIDVWVNAVGQSIRTRFEHAGIDEYRHLMNQNFFASVGCSLDALPWLKQSQGHLVNTGSLAAKIAWPFVAPYVTSKHALAGFAQQLRIEGPKEVHYLFVCTGPIANSDQQRYQQANLDLTDAAKKPGAGAPVKAIDPDQLASQIIKACERRKKELIVPAKSRILFAISQLCPSWADRLIARLSK